jgi:molybdopterin molybdotransferase
MISVAAALDALFALVRPLGPERVPLVRAAGRVLASPVVAGRNQPPFAASAMDGYAVSRTDAVPGAVLTLIGESAAGQRFAGRIGPGQTVRILTGAPLPDGADRVIIQEDVTRDGPRITLTGHLDAADHVRTAGADFAAGATVDAPRLLTPADIALMAAMNIADVPVTRRPDVALIATGNELVQPGETPGPDQIIASNAYGLHAMLAGLGAAPRLLPIARDNRAALEQVFALAASADLIVTIGGASVGDHDLVGEVALGLGLERAFYKIAMRPGKPLMAGRMARDQGGAMMIGLPGNPVSAMVCGTVFLAPVIRAMLGLPAGAAPRQSVRLGAPLPENGPREHYMRARRTGDTVTAFDRQDSALLTVLAGADCLLVRPPLDGPRQKGEPVEVIDL